MNGNKYRTSAEEVRKYRDKTGLPLLEAKRNLIVGRLIRGLKRDEPEAIKESLLYLLEGRTSIRWDQLNEFFEEQERVNE